MKIHNTLTKKKELFKPIEDGTVKMYLCGPTVYDFAHLGHGRSAVAFDIIRRYFQYKGNKVIFVSNYTDIDDKMISRANEEGITVKQLAEKVIPHYIEDYSKLNILPSTFSPKATEYIEKMIEIISDLVNKDFAYKIDDGIYFDISKDKEYGKLSGQKLDKLEAGSRVEENTQKRNHQDFVLWKFAKENEPTWEASFGNGRPGWHIECSAMGESILGIPFDIHAGGLDLIFPHHECEIAQSESSRNKTYVNYWMHNGFVQVNNEKMSKSLGNFFTLKDIFKSFNPRAIRLFLISTHYRSPIQFSDQHLTQAEQTLKRIDDFWFNLSTFKPTGSDDQSYMQMLTKWKEEFENAMDNDFEVPEALATVFTLIHETNKLMANDALSQNAVSSAVNLVKLFDSVLGVLNNEIADINAEIQSKIDERQLARKNKDFKKADEIRDELLKVGIELLDFGSEVKWRKIRD